MPTQQACLLLSLSKPSSPESSPRPCARPRHLRRAAWPRQTPSWKERSSSFTSNRRTWGRGPSETSHVVKGNQRSTMPGRGAASCPQANSTTTFLGNDEYYTPLPRRPVQLRGRAKPRPLPGLCCQLGAAIWAQVQGARIPLLSNRNDDSFEPPPDWRGLDLGARLHRRRGRREATTTRTSASRTGWRLLRFRVDSSAPPPIVPTEPPCARPAGHASARRRAGAYLQPVRRPRTC